MYEDLMSISTDKNATDALLQLLNPADINIKSDLGIKQIKALSKIDYFIKRFKEPNENPMTHFETVIEDFKVLMCSIDRKSRIEISDSVKEMKVPLPDVTKNPIIG